MPEPTKKDLPEINEKDIKVRVAPWAGGRAGKRKRSSSSRNDRHGFVIPCAFGTHVTARGLQLGPAPRPCSALMQEGPLLTERGMRNQGCRKISCADKFTTCAALFFGHLFSPFFGGVGGLVGTLPFSAFLVKSLLGGGLGRDLQGANEFCHPLLPPQWHRVPKSELQWTATRRHGAMVLLCPPIFGPSATLPFCRGPAFLSLFCRCFVAVCRCLSLFCPDRTGLNLGTFAIRWVCMPFAGQRCRRPARQYDRQCRPDDARAHRHHRRVPERAVAAQEQKCGAQGAFRPRSKRTPPTHTNTHTSPPLPFAPIPFVHPRVIYAVVPSCPRRPK